MSPHVAEMKHPARQTASNSAGENKTHEADSIEASHRSLHTRSRTARPRDCSDIAARARSSASASCTRARPHRPHRRCFSTVPRCRNGGWPGGSHRRVSSGRARVRRCSRSASMRCRTTTVAAPLVLAVAALRSMQRYSAAVACAGATAALNNSGSGPGDALGTVRTVAVAAQWQS